MQIIILGMHRSGTSMVTRLLNMVGAYIGPEDKLLEHRSKTLSRSNAQGHYERWDVMDMNDAVLAEHHASWDKPVTAEPINAETVSDKQQQAMRLCLYGMDIHRPWVMKDPRMCLTLPCWAAHLEMPVGIVVARNPQEIAMSLKKRDGIPIPKGLALWEYYITRALNASINIPRMFVDYNGVLARPHNSIEAICRYLVEQGCTGLHIPSQKEVDAFIDPSLKHANAADQPIEFANTNQQQLWQILQGRLPQVGLMECSAASKELLLASS